MTGREQIGGETGNTTSWSGGGIVVSQPKPASPPSPRWWRRCGR